MKIAIIGASKDRNKFGNKAVRAWNAAGHEVIPVNPKEKEIEGLPCKQSVLDTQVDAVSLYVPSQVGEKVADEIIQKQIQLVFINPGAESDALVKKLKEAGLDVRLQCSITAAGQDPHDF